MAPQIFLPNLITVLVAWSAFFYPVDNGMRISILMTTMMTTAIQYSSVSNSLPKVGYLKGIDLWMVGCLGLIFLGVLEYAVSSLVLSGADQWEKEAKDLSPKKTATALAAVERRRALVAKVDRWLRYGFLILLAVFLGIYFALYVYGKEDGKSFLTPGSIDVPTE